MKTRPEITDEEIRSYMDFDRLLEVHKENPPRNFSISKYVIALALITGAGVSYWYFVTEKTPATNNTVIESKSENKVPKEIPVTADSSANQSKTAASELEGQTDRVNKKRNQTSVIIPKADEKEKRVVTDKDSEERALSRNETPSVQSVYTQAEPVNGYPDLYDYFRRELKYPAQAVQDSIRGEVIAIFTINAEGIPEKITIENSLGVAFDHEVIRLITNMPAWKPATYNNKPVASRMSLPLTFQITRINPEK